MPARKVKSWLNGGFTSTTQPATGLDEHKSSLAGLKADTAMLRQLDRVSSALAEQSEKTAQAIESVSDKLLSEPSNGVFNGEWDKLEAARKKLTDQSAIVEKRLLSQAEALQSDLKPAIAAANRLLTAWREFIAHRVAGKIMEHVDPSRKNEAEGLCCKLALLSRDYVSTRERFAVPPESYAWTASLRPMPSQKLDTGLLSDPLYAPPDVRAQIRAILGCGTELCAHWGALLAEIEGSGAGFVAPSFVEPSELVESHPEWANRSDPGVKDRLLAISGKRVKDLSAADRVILEQIERDERSGLKQVPQIAQGVISSQ